MLVLSDLCVCVLGVDVPNAGDGLKRLSYKKEWDVDLRNYMKKLDQTKPVILCGDLNVAHLDIGKGWPSDTLTVYSSAVSC